MPGGWSVGRASGPRVFGAGRRGRAVGSFRVGGTSRATAAGRTSAGRQGVFGAARGFQRTSGFYGRFAGRPRQHDAELKFHDVDVNDAVMIAGGTIQNGGTVNIIPQGVTESQRVGRKCTIKQINWRFNIILPEKTAAGTPGPPDIVRLIMYLDKQCNGATATITDILEANDFQSFNNLANSSRFKTLMDRRYELNYSGCGGVTGTVEQSAVTVSDAFYMKCDIPIEFSSTTGALGEIRSNNIGVLAMSETGVCLLGSKLRLRFSDAG